MGHREDILFQLLKIVQAGYADRLELMSPLEIFSPELALHLPGIDTKMILRQFSRLIGAPIEDGFHCEAVVIEQREKI